MQDEDNIWARPTEKRLKNIRSRLSKANPLSSNSRRKASQVFGYFTYVLFGVIALALILYYNDPYIFLKLQLGFISETARFFAVFSILFFQLMSLVPDAYMPFVDMYWNIGISVVALFIFYFLYYVMRRQRADIILKALEVVVLIVLLLILLVFQINKDTSVFNRAFEFVTNLQIGGEKKEFREEVRSDFISYSLEDRMDIQLALKEYGYYSTIDGLFGNATFLAVKNYMVENDIVSYKKAILEDIKEAKFNKKPSTRMLLAVSDEKPRNSYVRVISASPYSVKIVDADTIDVGSDRVRLNGISADERGKPTYNSCKREVASIIRKSSEVICYMSGTVTYNREVGECFLMNKGVQEDLNRLIVESGCARDCKNYSGGYYKKFETQASKQLDLPYYCR